MQLGTCPVLSPLSTGKTNIGDLSPSHRSCLSSFQTEFRYQFTECDEQGGRWRVSVPASPACSSTPPSPPTRVDDCSKDRSSPHPSALFLSSLRPSERVPARSVPSKPPPSPLGGGLTGRNGRGRARTFANRAGTALTGAVRTGHDVSHDAVSLDLSVCRPPCFEPFEPHPTI